MSTGDTANISPHTIAAGVNHFGIRLQAPGSGLQALGNARSPEPAARSLQSVINGSNVHSASVTNTTSKQTSSASQNCTMRHVDVRLQQRRRAANSGNDDRNGDRIQQHRQQHVAAARPDEHRGEQRPDGREAERAR